MPDIRKLTAQYFQLVDAPALSLPAGTVLVQPGVQTALYERIFNDAAIFPVPPANYRARVLKLILSQIETAISDPDEDEISDDLIACWSTLVSQPKPSEIQQAQQLALIMYTAPIAQPDDTSEERTVITRESRGLILSAGTTGFRTWEAALHLGSFLATTAGQALVQGKRVIELGAGTGFVSLFCARHLGVERIVATDREPALIENMRECVQHNQPRDSSEAEIPFYPTVWEWGTPLSLPNDSASIPSRTEQRNGRTGRNCQFDIALGADLIYDADLVSLLLSTVRDLFDNYGVQQFIISATLRNEDTFRTFLAGCETNDFRVTDLPFESTPKEAQTGFFHSTDISIRTYWITRAS